MSVRLRLLAAVIALTLGAVAVVVAVRLVHTVVG
jgi:hypothetical protein